jgi:hypothetical protein
MIWFACKKCGKRQGRPDSSAGTLIFCDCGEGNRVPWNSSVAEPEIDEVEPVNLPPRPAVPPPPPRSAPPPPPPSKPPEMRPPAPRAAPEFGRLPRRGREPRRPNPAYCLNHEDRDFAERCDVCHCSFCADCVVVFQGKTLCGPCKNFRVRAEQRVPRIAPMATLALIVALVGGPVSFCLSLLGVNLQTNGQGSVVLSIVLSLIGAAFPIGGLVLARRALRDLAARPQLGGRAFALTGSATSLVGVLWCLTVALLVILKQYQG